MLGGGEMSENKSMIRVEEIENHYYHKIQLGLAIC